MEKYSLVIIMIRVENKKIIADLSKRNYKANKSRNRFIIITILLTTCMLSTVFSVGISYYQSYGKQAKMLEGISYDAILTMPTVQQEEIAENMDNVKYAGLSVHCANIIKYQEKDIRVTMLWRDDVNWEKQCIPALETVTGSYPEQPNEIMMSVVALEKCGIEDYYVGMALPMTYKDANGVQEETFILSGYYKDYTITGRILVSKSFYETTGHTQTDINAGKLYLTFHNPLVSEAKAESIRGQFSVKSNQILNINTEIISVFYGLVFGIGSLSILIMLCGYLLIYNVLYSSVSKEIRFYGLLNAIGTTEKQIKQFIRRQVIKVLLIGIPIGLGLGIMISFFIVPGILDSLSPGAGEHIVTFHPAIFLGAVIFSAITTILGSHKAANIAAAITPIEAGKYTEVTNKRKSKKKRSTNRGTVINMAWQNMFRNKRQACIVFLSLFIGLSLFVCISTLVNSQDTRNILTSLFDYDVKLENQTYQIEGEEPVLVFDDDIIRQLESLDGVASIHKVTSNKVIIPYDENILGHYMKEFYEKCMSESYEEGIKRYQEYPEDFYGLIVGIDEEYFDKLNDSLEKPVDKEKFLSGEACIVYILHLLDITMEENIGRQLSMMIPDSKKQQEHSLVIGGSSNVYFSNYTGMAPNIYVSSAFIDTYIEEPIIEFIDINFTRGFDRVLDEQIKAIIAQEKNINLESKIDQYDNMKQSKDELMVLGGGLSILIAFIGILNYVNMITTSIQIRKREFAILECIGMTEKQIKRMLTFEGLGYGMISITLVAVFGTLISYLLFQSTNYMQVGFYMPVVPIVSVFIIVLCLCLSIPVIVFRHMGKVRRYDS